MRTLFNMGTPRSLQKGLEACPRALWAWWTRLVNGLRTFPDACVAYLGNHPIPNLRDNALRAA